MQANCCWGYKEKNSSNNQQSPYCMIIREEALKETDKYAAFYSGCMLMVLSPKEVMPRQAVHRERRGIGDFV